MEEVKKHYLTLAEKETDEKLQKAKALLKLSVEFMNKVPNKKFGDNYAICSVVDKFLKEK